MPEARVIDAWACAEKLSFLLNPGLCVQHGGSGCLVVVWLTLAWSPGKCLSVMVGSKFQV